MKLNDIIIYSILITFFCIFAKTSHINKIIMILILSIICVFVEYDTFLINQKNLLF